MASDGVVERFDPFEDRGGEFVLGGPRAAVEELSDHLGFDNHDPAGRKGENSRDGARAKTVLTELGPVEIDLPRDRDGSFDPVIVRKRQRRLDSIDQIVLSLTARGLTTGEIAVHFADIYGASVSKDTKDTQGRAPRVGPHSANVSRSVICRT